MSAEVFDLAELERAHEIVGQAVPPTPAHAWPLLAQRLGTHVVVKHENHTPIGAFKVRGGLVYLDRLKRERPNTPGIISATRGNHGQSLAFAAGRHGVPAVIYVPRGNSVEKNRAMRAFGAELVEHGEDFQAAREEAARRAQFAGLHMVPSFHPDLVLGVATYALELLRAAPDLDVLYVPIGQGSGICGCIMARDLLGLKTEIVGVQSTEAPSYALSFAAGTVVTTETSNTLADGMATRVPVAEALAIIRKGASRIVQVTDDEVAAAVRAYWTDTHNLAEGAGAAPLAAALQEKAKLAGKRVGLILSGGNIDFDLFRKWIGTDAAPSRERVAGVSGNHAAKILLSSSGLTGRSSTPRPRDAISGAGDYWMPAFAGMTTERLIEGTTMNQPASAYFLEERHDPNETHTLSVLVQNEPGVLARVIGLFSGRGYNIESLTVSETESQKHLSRITIVTTGTPMVIEQIKHQLDRMVPVYRVVDMTITGRSIERELAMVKVRGGGDNRVEALRLADAFRARVIDATTESFVFEITGNSSKINQFIDLMRPLGLVEVSRTGVAAIGRGPEGM